MAISNKLLNLTDTDIITELVFHTIFNPSIAPLGIETILFQKKAVEGNV